MEDSFGRIIFAFVVEPNGKIDGERVVRSPVGRVDSLAKEFFNTMRSVKWRAGKCGGKYVLMLYLFPITIDITSR